MPVCILLRSNTNKTNFKLPFSIEPQYPIVRQRLTIGSGGKLKFFLFLKILTWKIIAQRTVLASEKRLSDYNITNDASIQFKDLGLLNFSFH